MTDIELRNEGGVIKGYDRETGEQVPVSFEDAKFNSVQARTVNKDVIYASENVSHLPGIQEALDSIDTDHYPDIHIVGGENLISETIRPPDKNLGSGDLQSASGKQIGIETVAGSYIKQADGADLEVIYENDNRCPVELDIEIDGNIDNQSVGPIGVKSIETGRFGKFAPTVRNCDIGVQISGRFRKKDVVINVQSCETYGLHVDNQDNHDNSTHQVTANRIVVFSSDNEIGVLIDDTAHMKMELYSHQDGRGFYQNSGRVFLSGHIRSIDGDKGPSNFNGIDTGTGSMRLWVHDMNISSRETDPSRGLVRYQGSNFFIMTNCNLGSADVVQVRSNAPCLIAGCSFDGRSHSPSEAIRLREGSGGSVIMPNYYHEISSGAIRADADYITVYGGITESADLFHSSSSSLDTARYNGVIGGGPIGGSDLSEVVGEFAGDLALSDGSSGDAGDESFTQWVWNGSEWKLPTGDTITPS